MPSFPPTSSSFLFEYLPRKELRMSYEKALEALKKGKYEDALTWFKGLPAAQRDGKTHALAGLAHFKREEYDEAAEHYDKAVTPAARTPPTGAKCKPSRRPTPPPRSTSKCPNRSTSSTTKLLAPPPVRDGDLPRPPRRRRRPLLLQATAPLPGRRARRSIDGGHGLAYRTGWAGNSATARGYGPTGTTAAGRWES